MWKRTWKRLAGFCICAESAYYVNDFILLPDAFNFSQQVTVGEQQPEASLERLGWQFYRVATHFLAFKD